MTLCAKTSLSATLREPARHLRPAMDRGAPACNQADMAAGQLDVLLVPAPRRRHQRPHALRRRDVILLRADHEERTFDVLELDRAPAEDELAAVELVALVEVTHPLPEELAGERRVLVRPLVERVEAFHVLLIPQVPPEVEVGGEIHR